MPPRLLTLRRDRQEAGSIVWQLHSIAACGRCTALVIAAKHNADASRNKGTGPAPLPRCPAPCVARATRERPPRRPNGDGRSGHSKTAAPRSEPRSWVPPRPFKVRSNTPQNAPQRGQWQMQKVACLKCKKLYRHLPYASLRKSCAAQLRKLSPGKPASELAG